MSRSFGRSRAKPKKWDAPSDPIKSERTKTVVEDLPGRKFADVNKWIETQLASLVQAYNSTTDENEQAVLQGKIDAYTKKLVDQQVESFMDGQDDAFQKDFVGFLQGRLKPGEKERVLWQHAIPGADEGLSLVKLPGVGKYLDKYAKARLEFEQVIGRLDELGPAGFKGKVDLDSLYMYYKYHVRGGSHGRDEFLRDWAIYKAKTTSDTNLLPAGKRTSNVLQLEEDSRTNVYDRARVHPDGVHYHGGGNHLVQINDDGHYYVEGDVTALRERVPGFRPATRAPEAAMPEGDEEGEEGDQEVPEGGVVDDLKSLGSATSRDSNLTRGSIVHQNLPSEIVNELKNRGLVAYDTVGDGACFFRAVVRGMGQDHDDTAGVAAQKLRDDVLTWVESTPEVRAHFETLWEVQKAGGDTAMNDKEWPGGDSLDVYLSYMKQAKTWVDNIGIAMTSQYLGRHIKIHQFSRGKLQMEGPARDLGFVSSLPTGYQGDGPKDVPVLYNGRSHYSGLKTSRNASAAGPTTAPLKTTSKAIEHMGRANVLATLKAAGRTNMYNIVKDGDMDSNQARTLDRLLGMDRSPTPPKGGAKPPGVADAPTKPSDSSSVKTAGSDEHEKHFNEFGGQAEAMLGLPGFEGLKKKHDQKMTAAIGAVTPRPTGEPTKPSASATGGSTAVKNMGKELVSDTLRQGGRADLADVVDSDNYSEGMARAIDRVMGIDRSPPKEQPGQTPPPLKSVSDKNSVNTATTSEAADAMAGVPADQLDALYEVMPGVKKKVERGLQGGSATPAPITGKSPPGLAEAPQRPPSARSASTDPEVRAQEAIAAEVSAMTAMTPDELAEYWKTASPEARQGFETVYGKPDGVESIAAANASINQLPETLQGPARSVMDSIKSGKVEDLLSLVSAANDLADQKDQAEASLDLSAPQAETKKLTDKIEKLSSANKSLSMSNSLLKRERDRLRGVNDALSQGASGDSDLQAALSERLDTAEAQVDLLMEEKKKLEAQIIRLGGKPGKSHRHRGRSGERSRRHRAANAPVFNINVSGATASGGQGVGTGGTTAGRDVNQYGRPRRGGRSVSFSPSVGNDDEELLSNATELSDPEQPQGTRPINQSYAAGIPLPSSFSAASSRTGMTEGVRDQIQQAADTVGNPGNVVREALGQMGYDPSRIDTRDVSQVAALLRSGTDDKTARRRNLAEFTRVMGDVAEREMAGSSDQEQASGLSGIRSFFSGLVSAVMGEPEAGQTPRTMRASPSASSAGQPVPPTEPVGAAPTEPVGAPVTDDFGQLPPTEPVGNVEIPPEDVNMVEVGSSTRGTRSTAPKGEGEELPPEETPPDQASDKPPSFKSGGNPPFYDVAARAAKRAEDATIFEEADRRAGAAMGLESAGSAATQSVPSYTSGRAELGQRVFDAVEDAHASALGGDYDKVNEEDVMEISGFLSRVVDHSLDVFAKSQDGDHHLLPSEFAGLTQELYNFLVDDALMLYGKLPPQDRANEDIVRHGYAPRPDEPVPHPAPRPDVVQRPNTLEGIGPTTDDEGNDIELREDDKRMRQWRTRPEVEVNLRSLLKYNENEDPLVRRPQFTIQQRAIEFMNGRMHDLMLDRNKNPIQREFESNASRYDRKTQTTIQGKRLGVVEGTEHVLSGLVQPSADLNDFMVTSEHGFRVEPERGEQGFEAFKRAENQQKALAAGVQTILSEQMKMMGVYNATANRMGAKFAKAITTRLSDNDFQMNPRGADQVLRDTRGAYEWLSGTRSLPDARGDARLKDADWTSIVIRAAAFKQQIDTWDGKGNFPVPPPIPPRQ